MYVCVLPTIAIYNSWSRDPNTSNTIQLRQEDVVRFIMKSRKSVICKMSRAGITTSITMKEDVFKRNFRKIGD